MSSPLRVVARAVKNTLPKGTSAAEEGQQESEPVTQRRTLADSAVRAWLDSPLLARNDQDLLSRTLQDCGLHAYGAIFVELWVLSSDGRHMRRPPGVSRSKYCSFSRFAQTLTILFAPGALDGSAIHPLYFSAKFS